ncbi:hypothetical protein HHL28_10730 [Aerophototrophica crusticola]|uniref:Uncharacterized protein n=1 Tax=Aerophototrophica crusticola TaxID=1709002 RepID=A0A858R813_9PROT|nr:hypothetical protein HHL28_10730 [Rhodospirillaceae bacterium B3]
MRAAILLSLMVILSAPELARAPLDPAEAGRFVAAVSEASGAPGALPIDAPGRIAFLAESSPDLLARHGFTPERWRVVGQRMLAAYQAQRFVDQPVPAKPKAQPVAQPTPTHWERAAMLAMAREQRADLAQLAEETEADRAALAPLLPTLHGLMSR